MQRNLALKEKETIDQVRKVYSESRKQLDTPKLEVLCKAEKIYKFADEIKEF